VGFENNLHLPSGAIATDNASLVRVTVQMLAALGLHHATCVQARARLDDDDPGV
jgi:uncharacterized protein (DUF849 family)